MRLDGKVALITGGTSGIGRRVIERYVEEGARVAFTGRRVELGNEVAAATGAKFIEADAGSESDAERVVKAVLDAEGQLDVLMNNAGAPAVSRGPLEDLDLTSFDDTMAVHVRGALAHMQHAAPAMRAARSGSIINVGSVAGHRSGYSGSIFYGIAKASVIHMTRMLAMELGEDGIRVNSISPGVIATGIFAKSMGLSSEDAEKTVDKAAEVLSDMQAIPRAGITDDIANAAVYLGSEEAGFVNGEDMVIDGGMIWGRRFSDFQKGGGTWARLLD